jgi:hypothetical protein
VCELGIIVFLDIHIHITMSFLDENTGYPMTIGACRRFGFDSSNYSLGRPSPCKYMELGFRYVQLLNDPKIGVNGIEHHFRDRTLSKLLGSPYEWVIFSYDVQ